MSDRQHGSRWVGRGLGARPVKGRRGLSLFCMVILTSACVSGSVASGASWESLEGPKASFVVTLAQSPHNPRELYAGVLGGGVLRSEDAGVSWEPIGGQLAPRSDFTGLGEPDKALDVESIAIAQDGRIFAGSLGAGVHVLTPEGNWMELSRGLGGSHAVNEVKLGGADEAFLYAGTQEGLYYLARPAKHDDKWRRLDDWQTEQSERVQALFVSDDPVPRIYAGTRAGFFRSLDNGETWQRATEGIDREVNVIAMAVNPQDADHVLVSSWDRGVGARFIYRSRDGGEMWERAEPLFDSVIQSLAFAEEVEARPYALTYSGDLYVGLDEGLRWELEDSLGVEARSLLQVEEGRWVVGTSGQGLRVRNPEGEWHSAQIQDVPLTVSSILPFDGELLAGTERCGIFRREEAGEWEDYGSGLPFEARTITSLAVDPESQTLYAGTHGDGVYERALGDARWRVLKQGLPDSALQIRTLKNLRLGSEHPLLAGTSDGLYRLQGGIWERVARQELKEEVTNIVSVPSTRLVFATGTGGQVFVSTDGGRSWASDAEVPERVQRLVLAHSSRLKSWLMGSPQWVLFAQTEGDALYFRTAKETAWRPVDVDLQTRGVLKIADSPLGPDGLLLIAWELADENLHQRISPSSTVTAFFQQTKWRGRTQLPNASILAFALDPQDPGRVYAGTANKGVYRGEVPLPKLGEQIPADAPIKRALPVTAVVVFVGLLAGGLYLWFTKPPEPVTLVIDVMPAKRDDTYQVQIQGPEGRSSQDETRMPGPLQHWEEQKAATFADSASEDSVMNIGDGLYTFVFGSSELQKLYASTGGGDDRQRMRLRFCVEGALAELPWELIYDEGPRTFLGLEENRAIARCAMSSEPIPDWHPARRLRVLAVAVSPRDRPLPMIEREVDLLRDELGALRRVDVDVLEAPATPSQLIDALQNQDYQVLHFVGHADPDSLILEDERGYAQTLAITDLISAMSRPGSDLTMVFLNACQTASPGSRPGIPSAARQLAAKGVPLVLAMQHDILNSDALVFVEAFYRDLAAYGSVVDAVGSARRSVFRARGSRVPPVWAIPVLLIRGSSGQLLRPRYYWMRKLGWDRLWLQRHRS